MDDQPRRRPPYDWDHAGDHYGANPLFSASAGSQSAMPEAGAWPRRLLPPIIGALLMLGLLAAAAVG